MATKKTTAKDNTSVRKGARRLVATDDVPGLAQGMAVRVEEIGDDRVYVSYTEKTPTLTDDGTLDLVPATRIVGLTNHQFGKLTAP